MSFLEKNRTISVVIAIAALAVAALVVLFTLRSSGGPTEPMAYYFDLDSKELFAAPASLTSPIKSKAGDKPEGAVRAYVYSCSDCGDKPSRFTGYLEKYDADAKKAIEEQTAMFAKRGPSRPAPAVVVNELKTKTENGHFIASESSPDKWVVYSSDKGTTIMNDIKVKCGDKDPIACFP